MAFLAEVSGWLGAVAVLAGYLLFSMGRIQNGRLFQTANLAGSVAMIVNGAYHGAWPSVATNVAWCAIAATALVRLRQLRRTDPARGEAPGLDGDELLPVPGPAQLEPAVIADDDQAQEPRRRDA
ncbi:CBU_0592 family membrane protein [Arthrobacter mobilis]|uniref:CBU_0592 family membrane protein n=1 Tax=Arthrobacter mobilis TaxID=2724944 RepID=UPI00197B0CA3|nr:hypothetical protein [Arthrobacter mobilis]